MDVVEGVSFFPTRAENLRFSDLHLIFDHCLLQWVKKDNDLKPEKTISWQPFAQMNSKYPLSSDNRIQRLKIHRFVDFCAKLRLKTFPQKSQWINIELYCMFSVETENWWSWQEDGRWLNWTLTRILEGDVVEDERVVAVLVHPLPGPRKVNIVLLPGHGQVHAGVSHNLT